MMRIDKALTKKQKQELKELLMDETCDFPVEQLQKIIDNEFFNDSEEMDVALVDAAAYRMSIIHGVSPEEQYRQIAYQALIQYLQKQKNSDDLE